MTNPSALTATVRVSYGPTTLTTTREGSSGNPALAAREATKLLQDAGSAVVYGLAGMHGDVRKDRGTVPLQVGDTVNQALQLSVLVDQAVIVSNDGFVCQKGSDGWGWIAQPEHVDSLTSNELVDRGPFIVVWLP